MPRRHGRARRPDPAPTAAPGRRPHSAPPPAPSAAMPRRPLDGRPAPDLDDRLPQAARRRRAPGSTPRCCSRRCSAGSGCSSTPITRTRSASSRGPTFRDLVRRRAEGTPVAYLVGRKEFYSLPLTVRPAVLIPRPDSEFVVVEFLAAVEGRSRRPAASTSGPARAAWPWPAPTAQDGAGSWRSTSAPRRWPSPRRTPRTLGLADRVEFRAGRPARPGRRRRAVRRDRRRTRPTSRPA